MEPPTAPPHRGRIPWQGLLLTGGSSQGNSPGLSVGAIVGIVIGVLAVVALI
uniref:Uncharacterized protein n=1 Tax=Propithecus coquereli TaxID=379532 RepID=A0A2K6FM59_PROCO